MIIRYCSVTVGPVSGQQKGGEGHHVLEEGLAYDVSSRDHSMLSLAVQLQHLQQADQPIKVGVGSLVDAGVPGAGQQAWAGDDGGVGVHGGCIIYSKGNIWDLI